MILARASAAHMHPRSFRSACNMRRSTPARVFLPFDRREVRGGVAGQLVRATGSMWWPLVANSWVLVSGGVAVSDDGLANPRNVLYRPMLPFTRVGQWKCLIFAPGRAFCRDIPVKSIVYWLW